MVLAPARNQQDQGAAVRIATFDDGPKPASGFGLPDQCGRFKLCRQAVRQAGIHRDR